jgi:alpha-1,2-mannosyltransferase
MGSPKVVGSATAIFRWLATRLHIAAPALLTLCIAARLAYTPLSGHDNFCDLQVYLGGGAALDRPGTLYSYTYVDAHDLKLGPLRFTYPAFAAVIFYPLHLLPLPILAIGLLWQAITIAALYGSIRVSQRLLGTPASSGHRVAMLWTATTIWIEPCSNHLQIGQVNMMLMLAALCAVYATRWWLSGLLVGAAAGIKVTPAITACYFVCARRWRAAMCSAAVFLATVAVSLLVVGDQARYYFTDLLGDTHRIGPVGIAANQSWRGGISRILGHDAEHGPLVLAAITVTAIVAGLAWRTINRRIDGHTDGRQASPDRLGQLIVVQLFGLLLSPISWTHHWVWVVPLMVWLIHGPLGERRGTRILGWGWLALTMSNVPWVLVAAQGDSRMGGPWYLSWAGLVYIVPAMATLTWLAANGRRDPAPATDPACTAAQKTLITLSRDSSDGSAVCASVHPGGVNFPERGVHPAVDQPWLHRAEPLEQFLRLLGHIRIPRGHHLDRLDADVHLVGGRSHVRDLPAADRQHVTEVALRQRAQHRETVDVVCAELEHVQARAGLGRPPQGLKVGPLQVGRGAEGVIKGAVDDGAEAAVQPVELGGVGQLEVH